MNIIYDISFIKNVDLSIYNDSSLFKIMNNYNKVMYDNKNLIIKLLEKDFFKVPHVDFLCPWGKEKVFYPFTSKLFKVLETNLADTSLQLHPLKTERYYSLSDNTVVADSHSIMDCKKDEIIVIPNNTVHSLLKGSKVFEEQDNLIFDDRETIRFSDKLNREVSKSQEYVKYLLPQFLKKFYKEKVSNYSGDGNKFVFIADGEVEIECGAEKFVLKETEELYYLSDKVDIISISGHVIVLDCIFYKLGE